MTPELVARMVQKLNWSVAAASAALACPSCARNVASWLTATSKSNCDTMSRWRSMRLFCTVNSWVAMDAFATFTAARACATALRYCVGSIWNKGWPALTKSPSSTNCLTMLPDTLERISTSCTPLMMAGYVVLRSAVCGLMVSTANSLLDGREACCFLPEQATSVSAKRR